MARIDSHLHVFAKVSSEFPREPTPVCPPEREETAEKLLDNMATYNIDQAMLVQYGGTSIEHHAYLRHCLRTYPDRFLGIGLIPPDCTEPEEHMDRLAEKGGKLSIEETHDGDTLADQDFTPLLTIDVWEHAYYLAHQNKRPEYLDQVIGGKLNWNFASENLARGETWKYPG